MVFSSLQFILIFLPLFLIGYYCVPDGYRNAILLFGSLIFYFVGTIRVPLHFILFVVSILVDFSVGAGMERYPGRKKPLLIAGVLYHLVCLCVFKYANFLLDQLGKVWGGVPAIGEILLPIGISFYTFQGLSYLADVYKGTVKAERSLLNFAVYISMFPQLIAGPIVTYSQVGREIRRRTIRPRFAAQGAGIFVFGLGCKVLLANPLGKLWSQTVAIGFESVSTPLAWMAVAAYSFQIYFDFFGYSLMAIGLGRMLGFRLPTNFRHPYTSLTMTELWRRWHITLGAWFREYVYIPLGGNRGGKWKTVRNLLAVWLLTGIWHGAGYNFILWGLLLFFLILMEKLCIGRFLTAHPALGHLYMILLIPLTWTVFAVNDLGQLGVLLSRLFPIFGRGEWVVFRHDYLKYLGQYWPFFLAGILFSTKLPYRLLKRLKSRVWISALLLAILLASLYCMYRGFDDPFLYFRF